MVDKRRRSAGDLGYLPLLGLWPLINFSMIRNAEQTSNSPNVSQPVLLFDGTCAMCSRLVSWFIAHESDHDLRFASLRSDAGLLALRCCGVSDVDFETMYLIQDGCFYMRSDAVACAARHLRWPWRALAATTLVPRVVRDWVYRFVARNRYRWFGMRTHCSIPVPSVRERFLDEDQQRI